MNNKKYLEASTVKEEESSHNGKWIEVIRMDFHGCSEKVYLSYKNDGIARLPDEKLFMIIH